MPPVLRSPPQLPSDAAPSPLFSYASSRENNPSSPRSFAVRNADDNAGHRKGAANTKPGSLLCIGLSPPPRVAAIAESTANAAKGPWRLPGPVVWLPTSSSFSRKVIRITTDRGAGQGVGSCSDPLLLGFNQMRPLGIGFFLGGDRDLVGLLNGIPHHDAAATKAAADTVAVVAAPRWKEP